jgi:hypothetical protein
MKQWFPLTDYDFYAYLISGMLLIGAVDYTLAGGTLVYKANWTVAEGLFWVTIAYLLGSISASPSAAILEHFVARKWMDSPADIQLGFKRLGKFERVFAALFAPREYGPLTPSVQARALDRASKEIGEPRDKLTGEIVFQAAFHPVRQTPDTAARLSAFLNQYGFSRNVAFASFVGFILLLFHEVDQPSRLNLLLTIAAIVLSLGMFGRFIKFYAAYSADVIRTYATLSNSQEK